MASRDPITIDFGGGQAFEIRPLTIAQVERIEGALAEAGPPVAVARRCIEVALSRDNPGIVVADIETDSRTVAQIFVAILRLGGFVPDLGEAGAAAGTNAKSASGSGGISADGSSPPPASALPPSTTSSSGAPSS